LELIADLVGVRVSQFVEDGQGVLPGGAGCIRVVEGIVSVAEASQDFCPDQAVPRGLGTG
jgi:hypothetical protein